VKVEEGLEVDADTDEADAAVGTRARFHVDADGKHLWRRYYEGEYVLRFRERRSRAKDEPAWSEPLLVAEVIYRQA
jgi:hypothetical protein